MKTKNITLKCLVFCIAMISSFGFFMDTAYCVDNRLNNKEGLESFFDTFFNDNMAQSKIPGAAFILVKDGDVVIEKGYGYYDLESKKEVDPNKTIFPLESTSKVITSIAAMQLVEQGKLDLHKNITSYITKFDINNPYDTPLTLHNLITHTSGFDDSDIEMYVKNKDQLPSLEEYLSKKLPDVVINPGEVISYGNHGFSLVGHLIEKATNMPFDKYIDKSIVAPLDMDKSGFFITEALNDDLALNYIYSNGEYERGSDYYHLYYPAGLFRSTVSDMGNFMISLLNEGRYQDKRILQEKTIDMVHNTQFTQHPKLEGWTYGFYEHFQNEKRVLMHGGDSALGYSSMLFMIPEENIGVFVAMNAYAHDVCHNLLHSFIDTYYLKTDETKSTEAAVSQNKVNLSKFTGNYTYNRYSRNTFLKLGILFNQLKVTQDEGILIVNNHIDSDFPTRWVNVEPLVFKSLDQDSFIVFNTNDHNKVDYMYSGRDLNFEKLLWYEYDTVNFACLLISTLFFITTIFVKLRNLLKDKSRELLGIRIMTLIISTLNISFLIGFVLYFIGGNVTDIVFRVPMILKLLFTLPIISVAVTLIFIVLNFKCWNNDGYHFREKIFNITFLIMSFMFSLFLINWNLLGFNF